MKHRIFLRFLENIYREDLRRVKFIKLTLGEFNKFLYEMIKSVRFCLSYDLSNAILSPSKFVYFNENLHYCHRRRHDVTCSRRKSYKFSDLFPV